MKYLAVKLANGEVWGYPAELIAKDRATYYAENDEDTTYEEEYNYTLSSDYEIGDWAGNNMNIGKDVDNWVLINGNGRISLQDIISDALCED